MSTNMDPVIVIFAAFMVASVVVLWDLIRRVLEWFYGVRRQKQSRKLLKVLAVVLWVLVQFITIKVLMSPKKEVGIKIPNMFPVLVITPGEGDETYKADRLYYKDLGDFINKNPEYTFLVPEGQDDHLNRTLHGGIEVKELSDGRQSLEVKMTSGESWCTGWYDATDKGIFPKYHGCMHGMLLIFMWMGFAPMSTTIIVAIIYNYK